jgi:hypothetical protein
MVVQPEIVDEGAKDNLALAIIHILTSIECEHPPPGFECIDIRITSPTLEAFL